MKAEISSRGILRLIPENETEKWAINVWIGFHNNSPTIPCVGIEIANDCYATDTDSVKK